MKCKICNKPSEDRVTCRGECASILKSRRATKNLKEGKGWGRGIPITPADKTYPTVPRK